MKIHGSLLNVIVLMSNVFCQCLGSFQQHFTLSSTESFCIRRTFIILFGIVRLPASQNFPITTKIHCVLCLYGWHSWLKLQCAKNIWGNFLGDELADLEMMLWPLSLCHVSVCHTIPGRHAERKLNSSDREYWVSPFMDLLIPEVFLQYDEGQQDIDCNQT